MPGIPARYEQTYNTLRRLTADLHEMMETGEFYTMSYGARRRRLRAVRRLYNKLVGPVSPRTLVAALATGVLMLAGCFQPTATNPDPDAGTDPDGDPATSIFIPSFSAPAQSNPFGIGIPAGTDFAQSVPIFADLDGDGDVDLAYPFSTYIPYAAYAESWGTRFYHGVQERQDDGTSFDPVSTLGIPRNEYITYDDNIYANLKALVDLDGDEDLDAVLVGNANVAGYYMEGILFMENTGSKTAAEFAPPEEGPFTALGSAEARDVAFMDVDGDGDQDMIYLEYIEYSSPPYQIRVSLNEPYAGEPVFTPGVEIPGISSYIEDHNFQSIEAADVDNDGDLDLLIGSVYSHYDSYTETTINEPNVFLVRNDGSADRAAFASVVENPFGLEFSGAYDWMDATSHGGGMGIAAADLDEDGDIDLLVGPYIYYDEYGYDSNSSTFLFFENTGETL